MSEAISRREFLKNTGFLIGAATIGSVALASACTRQEKTAETVTRVITNAPVESSPGARLVPLAETMPMTTTASGTGRVVEVSLEAKPAQVNLAGTTANLWTFNGTYPGPVIRTKRGDTLKIHYKNSLPATNEKNILGIRRTISNLHTHGLHVSPEPPADDIHVVVEPGGTYEYSYDLSLEEPGTLNFIHPHIGGMAAEQLWAGMVTPMITEDDVTALSDFESHLLILKDIALYNNAPAPHFSMMDYMMGKEGNIVTVNGQVNPTLSIKPGQVQRWRVLNASNARFYYLALEGHQLNVVGTDGGLLDKPYTVPSLLMAPGERVSILIKGSSTPGTYRLLSLPYSRTGMCGGCGGMGGMSGGMMGGGGMSGVNLGTSAPITLMTVTCQGEAVSDTLPAMVNPAAKRFDIDLGSAIKRTIVFGMGMGSGYVNGQNGVTNPYTIKSKLGTYEIWQIFNNTGMDHPFHQHVNMAQVLAINGGDVNYAWLYTTAPALKDVVIIPPMGSITLLLPVMDRKGATMFHCHILEHEDIGMRGMWELGDVGSMPGMG